MKAKRKSTTKKLCDQTPKLKELVAQLREGHRQFNNDLSRATRRLLKDAAKLGYLVDEIMKEGEFRSCRQLHIWLQEECGSEIPQRSFYRYIEAAENASKAEEIQGKDVLTEAKSFEALKKLANPKIVDETGDNSPKPALNEPPPKEWEGPTIRHPSANDEVRAGSSAEEMEETEESTKENVGDDRPEEPEKEAGAAKVTYFHHDCHDFQIGENSLQCCDQQGQTVILVLPKGKQMTEVLKTLLDQAGGPKQ